MNDETPTTDAATETIAARVCRVKAAVPIIPKNGFNPHGRYKHATVDDVYSAVRPLLADAGLDLRLDIVSREMARVPRGGGGETSIIHYAAAIGFVSVSGEREEPDHRFLSVPYTGPQTEEAAVSYLQKQYLRSRLQLETGDSPSEDALGSGDAIPDAITQAQVMKLRQLIADTQSDVDRFLSAFGIGSLAVLPASRYEEALGLLRRKAEKMKAEADPPPAADETPATETSS